MNHYQRKSKGFTLVEVLIVIVILALLAGMVIPRLIAQPERARIAEAQHTLGILKRAQINANSLTNAYVTLATDSTATQWQSLGIQAAPGGNYTYTCSAAGLCTADQTSGNGWITLGVASNSFACDGTVYVVDQTADRGCRPA